MSAALHLSAVADNTAGVQACTVAELAAAAGVSRRLVFLIQKAHRDGCAEVFAAVLDGSLTGSLAAELVTLFPHHDDQRAMLAEFKTLPTRKHLAFARQVAAICRGEA